MKKIACIQHDAAQLPKDIDALSEMVKSLREDVGLKDQKIDQQSQFIEQLLEQIRLARHQHFGTRSERFNIDQMALVFNEVEALVEQVAKDDELHAGYYSKSGNGNVIVPAHTRSRGGRRPLPAELPRVEAMHRLDEAECDCAACSQPMEVISEKVSEQLDIIPAQVQVIRHVRKTYVCKVCGTTPKTAKLPPQPIPKSLASPGTLAHIAVSKYVDALPLYRQERQLKRINIDLPRSTLARWVIQAGTLVQPLINVMRDKLLVYDIIAADETRLQVLKEVGKSAQSLSYFWAQRGGPEKHPILLYDYDPSRGSGVPIKLLGDFKGYLQSDGYNGYNAVSKNNGLWCHQDQH